MLSACSAPSLPRELTHGLQLLVILVGLILEGRACAGVRLEISFGGEAARHRRGHLGVDHDALPAFAPGAISPGRQLRLC